MIRVLTGLMLAVVCGLPAMAQSRPEACAAIADDGERLACYDAVFRGTGDAPAGDAVVIASERLIPAQPTGRQPATMTVACEGGDLSVSFAFAGQQISASGDIAPITFQVDQNVTSVRSLGVSDDNTSLGFTTPSESAAFLDSLAGGNSLKVRLTPARQRPLTVDFRLPPTIEAIAALRAGCEPR